MTANEIGNGCNSECMIATVIIVMSNNHRFLGQGLRWNNYLMDTTNNKQNGFQQNPKWPP